MKIYRITNPQGEVRDNLTREDVSAFKEAKGGVVPEGYVVESYESEPEQTEVTNAYQQEPYQQRSEKYGAAADVFPYITDAIDKNPDKIPFVEGVKDVFSLPMRGVLGLSEKLYDGSFSFGRTSEESENLADKIARDPWMAASALGGSGLGLAIKGAPFYDRLAAQGLFGLGSSLASDASKQEGYKPESMEDYVTNATIGLALGGLGEAGATAFRTLVSKYGKEQARRVIEGLMFGGVNKNRSVSGRDIGAFLSDPNNKAAFQNAIESLNQLGNKTKNLDEAVEKARQEFLSSAKKAPRSLRKGESEAEILGVNVKGKNSLSPDNSTAMEENLTETARKEPWDANAVAARNMSFSAPDRVSFNTYKYDGKGFANNLQQSDQLTGYVKKGTSAKVKQSDADFLDELAKYFDLSAKGSGDRFGDLKINGQTYSPTAGGVGKYFFDRFMTPLQEAALSSSGITPRKLLDVMRMASLQNDSEAIHIIMHAAKKLGYSDEAISAMEKAAIIAGKNEKLSDLIKGGRDIAKYPANTPVYLNVANLKSVNPLAGVSRFAKTADGIANLLAVRDANLNPTRNIRVIPVLGIGLRSAAEPEIGNIRKSLDR